MKGCSVGFSFNEFSARGALRKDPSIGLANGRKVKLSRINDFLNDVKEFEKTKTQSREEVAVEFVNDYSYLMTSCESVTGSYEIDRKRLRILLVNKFLDKYADAFDKDDFKAYIKALSEFENDGSAYTVPEISDSVLRKIKIAAGIEKPKIKKASPLAKKTTDKKCGGCGKPTTQCSCGDR